jgi:cation transport ATPase
VTIWQAAQSNSFWRTLVTPQDSSNDWIRVLLAVSILASFWDGFAEAVKSLRRLRPDMNALVLISIAAASGLGEWQEGATVAFLFSISHHLEAFSLHWTSESIRGAEAIVYGGERGGNERWIERFARIYTPAALALAVLVVVVPSLLGVSGGWRHWLQQGMVVLLISCPCALVISAPVAFSAAISSAGRAGFKVRNGSELEAIAGDRAIQPAIYEHAQRAMNAVKQNVAFAIVVKLLFLTLAIRGEASLWLAVLADTGAIVAVTLNGLRLLQARVSIPA